MCDGAMRHGCNILRYAYDIVSRVQLCHSISLI